MFKSFKVGKWLISKCLELIIFSGVLSVTNEKVLTY